MKGVFVLYPHRAHVYLATHKKRVKEINHLVYQIIMYSKIEKFGSTGMGHIFVGGNTTTQGACKKQDKVIDEFLHFISTFTDLYYLLQILATFILHNCIIITMFFYLFPINASTYYY
ncbi:hypothetical protein ACJX0J_017156 [Zea mays]